MADQNEVDEFLAHHGVKGMRWGARRDQRDLKKFSRAASSDASKLDKARAFTGRRGLTTTDLVKSRGSIQKASEQRVKMLQARQAKREAPKTSADHSKRVVAGILAGAAGGAILAASLKKGGPGFDAAQAGNKLFNDPEFLNHLSNFTINAIEGTHNIP